MLFVRTCAAKLILVVILLNISSDTFEVKSKTSAKFYLYSKVLFLCSNGFIFTFYLGLFHLTDFGLLRPSHTKFQLIQLCLFSVLIFLVLMK